jgi:hypothetical protein
MESTTEQKAHPLMRFFVYDHLVGKGREISARFWMFAEMLDHYLPDSAEKTVTLRKLLEAKDAGVRSTFYGA